MAGESPEKKEKKEESSLMTYGTKTSSDQQYVEEVSRADDISVVNPGPSSRRTTNATRFNYQVRSLEEANTVIASLHERHVRDTHWMLAYRKTLQLQEIEIARLNQERKQQLSSLSSQLLLFEANLCKKQKEIQASFFERETLILRQRELIARMQNTNSEEGGPVPGSSLYDASERFDNCGDSDSAVVLEENIYESTPTRFRSNLTDVTVIRSVSDAVEPSRKYALMRRCNGSRKPEVLETVYSVEEDDPEQPQPSTSGESVEGTPDCDTLRKQFKAQGGKRRLQDINSSFECLASEPESPPGDRSQDETSATQAQVTYNRVMGNNHRSVTKVKDVKYKRINKAKSKSLEELRGRLRNWVEKGNKIPLSFDHSYA